MGFIPWDGMIEKYERRGWTITVREGVDDARVKLEGHTLAFSLRSPKQQVWEDNGGGSGNR